MSRAGVQPVRAIMRAKKLTNNQVADAIRVERNHFANAVGGKARPCPAIRERLPEYLGVPLEQLFTEQSLDKPYLGDHIGRPRQFPVSS